MPSADVPSRYRHTSESRETRVPATRKTSSTLTTYSLDIGSTQYYVHTKTVNDETVPASFHIYPYGFCGNNVASARYDLHLYEADGVTPVLITLATPEPSSAALLLLSLTGLAAGLTAGVSLSKKRTAGERRASVVDSADL
jgi:hypothetical protein